ncbi:MAG TPA: uroporphyrinogen decarboxylase family protein [Candidatus Brocadiia bacterium]|nr:uroporphyrinogen decarboxylase family protein [Candidatus Brocadiia bacterium]
MPDAHDHDKSVNELMSAYWKRENRRVPVTFSTDEHLWLNLAGRSFSDFYRNPKTHLDVYLAGLKWECDNIRADRAVSYPDRWRVCPRLWMEENQFFGCQVVYQENDYAWAKSLEGSKSDLLARIADTDAEATIKNSEIWRLYCSCRELADGMEFAGRPVEIVSPGQGTHGIFTKACEVRGIERFCMDLYEDPDFAHRFLDLVTDKEIERIRAWHKLAQTGVTLPLPGGWGLCDDSLQLISAAAYRNFVLPRHERLFSVMTTGTRQIHLCGYAEQHYRCLREELGVKVIDGPGPFVDHGKWLEALGDDFGFNAQMDHSILLIGTPTQVDRMMRDMLTPAAKKPGRFQISGYIVARTPLENVRAAYEAGWKYGQIQSAG